MLEDIHKTVRGNGDENESPQVERILRSEILRHSDVLRRLLSYLANKTLSGEADALKEYVIAIEALGKPATYDPKHDSTVRIQVSRLRQKLGEYYRGEGTNDPIIVDLPKGHFKLTFEARPVVKPSATRVPKIRTAQMPVWIAMLMSLFALLIPLAWREYSTVRHLRSETMNPTVFAAGSLLPTWPAEIQALWGPFLINKRPMILAIEDPLFMELQLGDGIYYRDRSVDEWDKLAEAPVAVGLRKLLHNPKVQPSHYYTTVGEVYAGFLVGKLLAAQQNISLVRSSELTWQQLADNNVLLVGKKTFFDTQLDGMPIHPQFVANDHGVENSMPGPGELRLFSDQYSMAPAEEGLVYALVTRLPGVGGGGEFASFISNRAAGYEGALQWFTDPKSARILTAKLTNAKGEFPKYYQVLLKVKFKDEIPTEVSYVLGRRLD